MRIQSLKRLIATLAALSVIPAQAAGLTVSPPYARFAPGQQTAEVRLTNESEAPVSVQASAQSWQQSADGVEQEAEATDFALYPKVFTVAPGQTQVVRLGRLPTATAQPQREVAYRLTLRELPVDDGKGQGISVTTRLRLPVWLLPAAPQADWGLGELQPLADGMSVTVANRGNVHVRLVDLEYAAHAADGAVRERMTVPGWYVLAGASKPFPHKLSAAFCTGTVKISAVARTAEDSRRAEWPAAVVCGRGA